METDQQGEHGSIPPYSVAGRPSIVIEEALPKKFNMAHDSLVTVRLSEPDSIMLDSTATTPDADPTQLTLVKEEIGDFTDEEEGVVDTLNVTVVEAADITPRDSSVTTPEHTMSRNLQDELGDMEADSHDSDSSDDHDEVNWEQLEKTEGEQKDDETDNVSGYSSTRPQLQLLTFIVNGTSAGTAGTGKRKIGYEPEDRQSPGCGPQNTGSKYSNQITTSFNGSTQTDGQWANTACPTILNAPSPSADRS